MARPSDKPTTESEKSSEKPTPETTAKTEASAGGASETQAESKDKDAKSAKDKDEKSAGGESSKTSGFVERLKSQHKAMATTLDKRSTGTAEPAAIAKEFAAMWTPRTLVDREILRGAARKGGAAEAIAEAEVRRDLMNILLANLLHEGPRGAEKAVLEALAEQFAEIMQAGEREGGLFEAIDSFLASGDASVSEIERRYERAVQRFESLDDDLIGEAIELLAPRRLSVPEERQQGWERSMPRSSSQTRDRDEQGRFLPEEDRDYGRGGGSRGMFRRDEGGRYMSRDEGGRYMSDERRGRGQYDEESGRGRRSSSRDYDEDERRSGSSRDRGQGGWFGDTEGHSEASHRGWENSDHGRSGWYGDREGHSEASRRGWENSDHGRSGWYGASEGHSEAARRGWEEGHRSQRRDEDNDRYGRSRDEDNGRYARSRHDDDERRSASSGYESRRGGRDEEDDDRSSNTRRGWSGDPEGHSEAARRGWERRR